MRAAEAAFIARQCPVCGRPWGEHTARALTRHANQIPDKQEKQ